jgi:hypothetical protein
MNKTLITLFSRITKLSLDKICIEICIKLYSNWTNIHHKSSMKCFWKNKKRNSGPKAGSVLPRPNRRSRPCAPKRPSCSRLAHPRPGRNLGLGRDSGHPLSLAWAEWEPGELWPSDRIGRSFMRLARSKSASDGLSPNPNNILSLPFSLIRAECNQQPRMAARGGSGGGGAAAAPLADARHHRGEPRWCPLLT